ncbi:MAG: hypothetical protein RIC55_20045 [Pirellulaceae bacterium]
MLFSQLIPSFRSESRLRNASRGIAARIRHDVWQRVAERAPSMGANETRGYIRARAASLVQREVDQLYEEDRTLKTRSRPQLIDLASEELVRQIIAHIAAARTATIPATAPRRRAA